MANEKIGFIKIKRSETVKKELLSTYSKFQLLICRWIKVEPMQAYRYFFRIEYYGGGKLIEDEILISDEGVMLMVVSVQNNIAILITHGAFKNKPRVHGRLTRAKKED